MIGERIYLNESNLLLKQVMFCYIRPYDKTYFWDYFNFNTDMSPVHPTGLLYSHR